ncbi:uncharacterized protein LY79DRAFT_157643 [Colletotrichum navitas]|uniref:Uncharacterized protein n=1 Tax=Colletotrichum navitas TaxID=681940 RepID=A0AAD8Q3P8_9PEZI|nr:uncharacterized protein LY79DRAFT_157643 [Colletotrichum navitas]KAK1594462.1 hypothetical protein LY79DRAFT_157643 [Colletotrichum navitas]
MHVIEEAESRSCIRFGFGAENILLRPMENQCMTVASKSAARVRPNQFMRKRGQNQSCKCENRGLGYKGWQMEEEDKQNKTKQNKTAVIIRTDGQEGDRELTDTDDTTFAGETKRKCFTSCWEGGEAAMGGCENQGCLASSENISMRRVKNKAKGMKYVLCMACSCANLPISKIYLGR